MRKNSLKRLFSFGRRSADDDSPKEDGPPETEASKPTEIFPHIEPLTKPAWRCFSYEEVFEATNGFHSGLSIEFFAYLFSLLTTDFCEQLSQIWFMATDNLVGQGGYAEVYRGVLKEGQVIAVKRLTRAATDEQREKEFLTELGTIGHVCHPNISCLIGCCIDNGLHLIFEFSAHGCVASRLHGINGKSRRNCFLLYRICLDFFIFR